MKIKKIVSYMIVSVIFFNIFSPLALAIEGSESYITFENKIFENEIINQGIDTDNDGHISIEEANNVQQISLSSNCTSFNDLKYFTNLSEFHIGSIWDTEQKIDFQNLTENLNKFNPMNLNIQSYFDIGTIELNSNGEINLTNVSPIIAALNDNKSKLYNENLTFKVDTDYDDSNNENLGLSFDKSKYVINVDTTKSGENEILFTAENSSPSSFYSFKIKYKVILSNDTSEEVEFADNNLKQYILDNNDYNFDGKITEYDMEQITNLSVTSGEISSLEGLQYATNLNYLYISVKNNNCDISQLSQLTNLNNLNIINGNLRDYLKNLNNLKSITCQYGIIDINNLNVGLESFSYYGYNLSNTENLGNLSNLNNISIYNYNDYNEDNKINYDFVENLDKLLYFTVSDNNGTINMEKFNNLENLYTIQLSNLTLTNLNLLKGNSSATSYIIGLNNCNITNISFVKNFAGFYSLSLRNNKISDISYLKGIQIKGDQIYLNGNSINLEEEKNAETIQYFQDNNIKYSIDEYDDSEEVIFTDEKLKNVIVNSKNPKYDTNNDGKISKKELGLIENLSLYDGEICSLGGLENAVNLKSLSLYNNHSKIVDITAIKDLEELTSLTISSMKAFDYETISSINNLEELNFSSTSYYFNDTELDEFIKIKNLTNLKKLSIPYINGYRNGEINEKIENFYDNMKFFKKLTKLEIGGYGNQKFNCEYIKQCTKINELKITSAGFDNLDELKLIPNLNKLYLDNYYNDFEIDCSELGNSITELHLKDFPNIYNLSKLTNIKSLIINNYSYSGGKIDLGTLINDIESLNLNNIELTGDYYINIGSYKVGNESYVDFDEVSSILEKVNDSSNIFYVNDEWKNGGLYYTPSGYVNVEIDNNIKKIIINTEEFGNKKAIISLKNQHSKGFNGNIILTWLNTVQADQEKEISIPDINFKNALLEKYDLDHNEKITEYDLVNLEKIDISNKNISDLTGIEHCINLKEIDANSNNLTSLEPVRNLINIKSFNFTCNKIEDISPLKNWNYLWGSLANNYITDLTCLKEFNADELDSIDFRGNYINIEDGSENLNTLNELCDAERFYRLYHLDYCLMHSQKYGSVNERNDILIITDLLKNKLIEYGVDSNNDGNITKGELNDFNQGTNISGEGGLFRHYKMDLSGLNLTSNDITCLKYLNCIDEIDLSNNKITDVSMLQYMKYLYKINLSNNNVNVSTLTNITASTIDLTYNNISNIYGLETIKSLDVGGGWFAGGGDGPRYININLSNNNIKDISNISGLMDKLYKLNLSNNKIEDISILQNYNFDNDENNYYTDIEYDFSNNYIDINSDTTKSIVQTYKNNNIVIKLDNQQTKVEKIDNETGIKIETTIEAVPENVVLEIEQLDTSSELNQNLVEIIDTLPNTTSNTKFKIFDIKLVDNANNEIQPNGRVTVYLPIPNGFSSKVKVYNINPSDNENPYTLLDTTIETIDNQKYAKFTTNHFSYYSMVNGELTGDVNGDGKVNITDVALINSHVKKVNILTGDELIRADVNGDGKVNITDVGLVNSHVKKVKLLW